MKPEKPKRPMSNYFIFLMKRRAELAGDPVVKTVIQLTRKCGAEWSALNDEEKLKYRHDSEYGAKILARGWNPKQSVVQEQ